ncbi:methyltransferase family protein [Thalassolituus marinus]|uniref:Isoprenylcysteine carboxylmethyltransferase family protein n=1 Tax=Thalassolituus marinus TaxID=671053 RepID=A0ABS7ZNT8_9GAMM|nr:isoprenylcysteine carboxylmethyltransferase family protein [Thalassolituus marinus]MCA6063358.1 isoprenylcysteine carboxylmethyltransferase family protein [Thalassolituus marinus]
MAFLEHKVPPPLVALICALLMWQLSSLGWQWQSADAVRYGLVAVLVTCAVVCDMGGLTAFLRRRTTINPLNIRKASTLVTSGVYQVTRNPMYLGLALLLCAWWLWLQSISAAAGVIAFVVYITRFQIVPEERVLLELFGEEYSDYCRQVRRWL